VQGTGAVGKLEPRGTEILQVLLDESLISVQILLSFPPAHVARHRRLADKNGLLVPVSLIVYGPSELSDDVGAFFEACGMFLQDPIGCDRNVQYRNPHRLTWSDGLQQMTFDLPSHEKTNHINDMQGLDVLDTLTTPMNLPELDTPSALHTQLLSYVFQKFNFQSCSDTISAIRNRHFIL
jgi:SWI/SNF-related matrix-associated actin-dependent regulator of chromatin subfamily A3